MPLLEVYEDYQRIAEQLDHEKFVLIGRKGSGKSAFGTYICEYAKTDPSIFAKFVRRHDYDLELVTRGAAEAGIEFNPSIFVKWLALTHIIKLFLQNEAAQASRKFVLLEQFLSKNSGYVEINRANVVSEIRRHNFTVSTELFRRFLKNQYGRSLDIKEERAHYSRLLPHLEQVVRDVLNSRFVKDNDNSFYLFFDDLDLGYIGDQDSKSAVVELLRTLKALNLETFSGTQAKAVVLLRDDIALQLKDFADTAKLLDTYGYRISWIRERELKRAGESEIFLKKMINRRISYACQYAGVPSQAEDPWRTLVSYVPDRKNKTTFRDIVDHTLFRPRDLIVFFSPLNDSDYRIPLGQDEVKKLKEQYQTALYLELRNEMAATYSEAEADEIFNVLASVGHAASYDGLLQDLRKQLPGRDPEVVLNYLYSRSIVGNVGKGGQYWFACRSLPGTRGYDIDKRLPLIVQVAVRKYLAAKKAP